MMRDFVYMKHEQPCWGGHDLDVTCAEATKIREEERTKLFYCSKSDNHKHSFMGDTLCMNDCGRSIYELRPEAEE